MNGMGKMLSFLFKWKVHILYLSISGMMTVYIIGSVHVVLEKVI